MIVEDESPAEQGFGREVWYVWNGYRGDLIAAINASTRVHWFNALSARRRSPEPMATMELSSARCCVLQGKLEQRVSISIVSGVVKWTTPTGCLDRSVLLVNLGIYFVYFLSR